MEEAYLHDYLRNAKEAFATPVADAMMYIGNQAGDLDSMVSALIAGYTRSLLGPLEGTLSLHFAIMPLNRKHFRLRRDAVLLFKHCGFKMDEDEAPVDLIFYDDISKELASAWRARRPGITLVDHNRLGEELRAFLGPNVLGIIDHHADEGWHTEVVPTLERPGQLIVPRQIEVSASAASIVAREFLIATAHRRLGTGDEHALTLLLGTVAVDNRGFDPTKSRYSFLDVHAAKGLLSALRLRQAGLPEKTAAFIDEVRASACGTAETPCSFSDALKAIESEFDFSAVPFSVGGVRNAAGENPASSMLLSLARFADLTASQTLELWGDHYRTEVLGDPKAKTYPHPNIRTFVEVGWPEVKFPEGLALSLKLWPTSELLRPRKSSSDEAETPLWKREGKPDAVVGQAIRSADLPAHARIGPEAPATIGALGKMLLESRYDVHSLSAAELLALDYKEVQAGGLRVGMPGIFTSLTDFMARAGLGRGTAALLSDFMTAREVDVIVALTRAPKEEKKGSKGLLLMSKPGSVRAFTAAELLRDGLERATAQLPQRLLEHPLFIDQKIPSKGFGLAFKPIPGGYIHISLMEQPAELLGSSMRKDATRKTLMPAVQALLERSSVSQLGDAWWAEWQRRLESWWSVNPSSDKLASCLGALSLHLGSRLDAAARLFGGGGETKKPPKSSKEKKCDFTPARESLALPDFPNVELPEMQEFRPAELLLPIPGLLMPRPPELQVRSEWEQLQAAMDGAAGWEQLQAAMEGGAPAEVAATLRTADGISGASSGAISIASSGSLSRARASGASAAGGGGSSGGRMPHGVVLALGAAAGMMLGTAALGTVHYWRRLTQRGGTASHAFRGRLVLRCRRPHPTVGSAPDAVEAP